MKRKHRQAACLLAAVAALGSLRALAQTDVAASLYGAFSGRTTGNGVVQSPSNSAGAIVELRHISNPIVGYEATYSFNRANQAYLASEACSLFCSSVSAQTVSADAHEVTADWIASVRIANLRPFALAGAGLLFNQPAASQSSARSATKPVFVYGAGLDWGLLPHIGLRLQYRGNVYKAPNLSRLFTSTNAFTRTAEPMIGVYFRL